MVKQHSSNPRIQQLFQADSTKEKLNIIKNKLKDNRVSKKDLEKIQHQLEALKNKTVLTMEEPEKNNPNKVKIEESRRLLYRINLLTVSCIFRLYLLNSKKQKEGEVILKIFIFDKLVYKFPGSRKQSRTDPKDLIKRFQQRVTNFESELDPVLKKMFKDVCDRMRIAYEDRVNIELLKKLDDSIPVSSWSEFKDIALHIEKSHIETARDQYKKLKVKIWEMRDSYLKFWKAGLLEMLNKSHILEDK